MSALGLNHRELFHELSYKDGILLLYRSISRQLQSQGEKSHTAMWVRTMIGNIFSVEQAHWRRSPAIRQQCCCYRSCIIIQVSEYLLNNCWAFNAGNYLDEAGKFATNISLLEGLLLDATCYTPQPRPRGRCCAVSGYSPGVIFCDAT